MGLIDQSICQVQKQQRGRNKWHSAQEEGTISKQKACQGCRIDELEPIQANKQMLKRAIMYQLLPNGEERGGNGRLEGS